MLVIFLGFFFFPCDERWEREGQGKGGSQKESDALLPRGLLT